MLRALQLTIETDETHRDRWRLALCFTLRWFLLLREPFTGSCPLAHSHVALMFLELSFDSQTPSHDASASASTTAQRGRPHRHEESASSLDDLLSDFHASATTRQSPLSASSSSSDVSGLRAGSPPRHSKAKDASRTSWNFASRVATAGKNKNARNASHVRVESNKDNAESSSNDGGAVMPLPRRLQPSKPKTSLKPRVPKQRETVVRSTAVSRVAKPRAAPLQRRKQERQSPVLSSPSLTPPSLSPLTSSPSSVSEDIYDSFTPDEDSIDALIGQDIRALNALISSGATYKKQSVAATKQPGKATRSRTADEIATPLRHSMRFRKEELERGSPRSRLSPRVNSSQFRLKLAKANAKPSRPLMPESPPPPPPPSDEEEFDDEEDSFAEEIRKLRESRRRIEPRSEPESKPEADIPDATAESSEICAAVALKVRNASNAIDNLLLDALKPFEDRQRELKQAALEVENADGDAMIRNAADSALSSAAQTIVSQLNITFADMTERRNAELKAEDDAEMAAKEAEKKEKEEAEEKRKAEEKEAKQREMEILRLLPMRGKLLTCSSDIETALSHIESAEEATEGPEKAQSKDGPPVVETEIEALRRRTQEKIQGIEARLAAPTQVEEVQTQARGISWRQVDWMQENFIVEGSITSVGGGSQCQEVGDTTETENPGSDAIGAFEDVLKRQVTEKLDLTILQLKHVLAIDSKEAAEALAAQKEEQELHAKQQEEKQLEDECKQRELEDAENARRRVMGVTSVEEVSGWVEEERLLRSELEHDHSLQRLMSSLNARMDLEHPGHEGVRGSAASCRFDSSRNHSKVLHEFDRLVSAKRGQRDAQYPRLEAMEGDASSDEDEFDHRASRWSSRRHEQRVEFPSRRQQRREEWLEMSGASSNCNDYDMGSPAGSEEGAVSVSSLRQAYHKATRHEGQQRSRSPRRLPPPYLRRSSPAKASVDDGRHPRFDANDYIFSRDQRHSAKPDVSIRSSSKHKASTHRSSAGFQQKMARTIQALQTDRRKKTSWIKSQHNYEDQPAPAYW